jgi:5-methylthioadenosine/S-adenosylhomocysteine deaminase
VQRSSESLVRNVDGLIFGRHRARAVIDLPSSLTSPRGGKELAATLAAITNRDVDALYVHLAEGQRTNSRSVKELDHLKSLTALTPATVIIHGTALTRTQLGEAADAGAKLVWSPQSNLRLYKETTRIADALDVGLPIALGADWLPTGSTSLLAEMKVARQESANQGRAIEAQDLVAMVTSGAAAIAGLADTLGALEAGAVADLVVFNRTDDDAYESVCQATPNDVQLVLIDGQLCYGRSDWVEKLAHNPTDPTLEPVLAWGRPMLLNTSLRSDPTTPEAANLNQLRSALTAAYPPWVPSGHECRTCATQRVSPAFSKHRIERPIHRGASNGGRQASLVWPEQVDFAASRFALPVNHQPARSTCLWQDQRAADPVLEAATTNASWCDAVPRARPANALGRRCRDGR